MGVRHLPHRRLDDVAYRFDHVGPRLDGVTCRIDHVGPRLGRVTCSLKLYVAERDELKAAAFSGVEPLEQRFGDVLGRFGKAA